MILSTIPSLIMSSFSLTQILKLTVSLCIFRFFDKNLNFIGQLFNDNGHIKPWEDIKIESDLKDTQKIYWLQLINALLFLFLTTTL